MKSAARLRLYLLVGGILFAVSSAHADVTGQAQGAAASTDGSNDIAPKAVTLVPEPRAALLGGIGMLLLLRRRRA